MDDERLLAHGRHRVRHRQIAARPRGRQHPRRGDADVPQPVGTHPVEDAEKGPRQNQHARSLKPAAATPDCSRSPLRSLREDLPPLGGGRDSRAALLHRGLPKHRHLKAGVRLYLRLSPAERRRLDDT